MTYKSERIYHVSPWMVKSPTSWNRVAPLVVSVEKSIAYPEGGGQYGDTGYICQGDIKIPFRDTQKVAGKGRTVLRPDFPTINVEGEIHLHLEAGYEASLDRLHPGEPVLVEIDPGRRASLTRSHSASHVLYLHLLDFDPQIEFQTYGCSIQEDHGRFDVGGKKIEGDTLQTLETLVNNMASQNLPITFSALSDEPECRFWHCSDKTIPCGGTHLDNTRYIGKVSLKRKNLGKGKQRIQYTLNDPLPEELLRKYLPL